MEVAITLFVGVDLLISLLGFFNISAPRIIRILAGREKVSSKIIFNADIASSSQVQRVMAVPLCGDESV